MDPIKVSPHHLRESSLDILRGAINRYTHIITTDSEHQWSLLQTQHQPRSSTLQVYKRTAGASEIYKVVVDITARADRTWTLNSWHALFQCVGTRKLWDQMTDGAQVLDRPDSTTLITQRTFKGNDGCIFAEKTTRKHNVVRHISTATTLHSDTAACPALAGYDIRISPDDDPNLDARVTFYYEIVSPILSELESYVLSLVTGPLSTLALHGAPPAVLREHAVKRLDYDADLRLWELEYQVLPQPIQPGSEPASPSSAVSSINISRKSSLSHWPHNSWDRSTSSLQLASSLRHRRGSFMGSLLLPPTSASYSTTRPKPLLSLYDAAPDISIEFDNKTWANHVDVDLSVVVPGFGELDCKMIDQFAQLCIRCYAERQENRYLMTLYHPPQLIQYLMEGKKWNQSMNCPEITVKLQVMPKDTANDFGVFVNGKEWPIHSWIGDQLFSDESSEDEAHIDSEDDHDVFVGDMEDESVPVSKQPLDLVPMITSHSEQTSLSVEKETSSEQDSSSLSEENEHKDEADEEEKFEESEEGEEGEEGEAEDVMIIPETDPEPVHKMRNYFETLIHSDKWRTLQPPEPSNLFVTIKKIDVPGHPSGAFLSESVWKDCSIWDVKAIVNCIGTRKIWDSTYEDGAFLRQFSKTCSLWHHRMKGFWTVSARDYVSFTSAYTSGSRIDLCATSCDPTEQPVSTAGYVRARLDLWNWRIERLDSTTTSVKLINQANPQGWIPSYVPNSLSGHNTDLVMRAHQFFNKYGAPPDLTLLEHGTLVNVSYDHHRQSWRCEYTLSTDDICTLAQVRLRLEKSYTVVIDPPPSSVNASTRTHDPYGVWIEISHKESDIIPQRGRILLLIKPNDQNQLVINGDITVPSKDLTKSIRLKDPIKKEPIKEEPIKEEPPTEPPLVEDKSIPEQDEKEQSFAAVLESLPVSPLDLAQSALTFLTRVSDQQFGWSSVLDKNGLKISKRSGTTKLADTSAESIMKAFINEQMEIPEPSVIVKASKVIEGFSLEEVASIVTNTGNLRKQYDEAVEEIETLYRTRNGCQIVRQLVKGIFPFKSREIFISACTAHEKVHSTTNPSAKRILYVEASIPKYPGTDPSKRPPALFSLSGWILEAIDPYTTTTNHPIPSMRATCLASLDLGSSVPTYMSNLVTMGLPKRMKAIEKLLYSQGPPPYLAQPFEAQLFATRKIIDDLSVQGPIEWTKVDTSYDTEKYIFRCNTKLRLLSSPPKQSIGGVPSKSNLSTSLLTSKQVGVSSSTSNMIGSSSSIMSGMSMSTKTTRSAKEPLTKVSSPVKPTSRETNTMIRAIIDLRNYKKGYEVMIHMIRDDEKDVSSMLSVNVSELAPEPSHLIANTNGEMPRKHAVQVTTTSLLTHDKEYALELQLIPVTEECLNKRETRLTVSGVLGEDDGQWHGMVLLNGQEIQVGSTVDVAAPVDSPILHQEVEELETPVDEGSIHDETVSMLGGGVVAAALGGVSASVNQIHDFRARMLLPFRQASSSFLSSTPVEDENSFESPISSLSQSSDDEKDTTVISPSVLHRRSRLRSMSDVSTRRSHSSINKSGFLVMICILLFLLLLMIAIRAPPSAKVLDTYRDARRVRQLWQIPWFGGWHVEIIAVQR